MENCIFCKIIAGEIPCYKILENEKVFAFLDIRPVFAGHVLVVPKRHFSDIFEIEDDYLKEVILAAKTISLKMKNDFNVDGLNLFQANESAGEQEIFHFHLHLLPRKNNDGFSFSKLMSDNVKNFPSDEFEEIKNKLKI